MEQFPLQSARSVTPTSAGPPKRYASVSTEDLLEDGELAAKGTAVSCGATT